MADLNYAMASLGGCWSADAPWWPIELKRGDNLELPHRVTPALATPLYNTTVQYATAPWLGRRMLRLNEIHGSASGDAFLNKIDSATSDPMCKIRESWLTFHKRESFMSYTFAQTNQTILNHKLMRVVACTDNNNIILKVQIVLCIFLRDPKNWSSENYGWSFLSPFPRWPGRELFTDAVVSV